MELTCSFQKWDGGDRNLDCGQHEYWDVVGETWMEATWIEVRRESIDQGMFDGAQMEVRQEQWDLDACQAGPRLMLTLKQPGF